MMNPRRMASLAERYRELHDMVGRLITRKEIIRDKLRKELDLGHHDHVTIYRVSQSVVKSFKRRSYRAVRVKGV